MKKFSIYIVLLFLLATLPSIAVPGKTSLTGKITDKETGQSIPGVTIYIPDLKTGAVTNMDGVYKIDNLPQTSLFFQVSFLGYKTITEIIDLSTTTTKDFILEPSVKEMNEVVVTGLSQAGERQRTPTPIRVVPKIQLLQNASTNIIDALSKQPGISQITTGAGISKPVIRGLGYNRVVIVNDGIRQEGQQWGDEHGIEIDEFSVNRVEILKGPASLSYGSDAIAGVINMLSAPTVPDGSIIGNVLGNYQTNNGLIGYSANLAGNRSGFIWDLRYSNKMAHDYQNKYDGFVFNSGYREHPILARDPQERRGNQASARACAERRARPTRADRG
ncbi:MAG TPA: TonB-dependent receptor plug domain-containing protein, partial [Bacteroidia bacterium]|nr:TonB-dependent receptor plug domain-containing protein [Bacteroidia bacterium]